MSYKKLVIWQKARESVIDIHKMTLRKLCMKRRPLKNVHFLFKFKEGENFNHMNTLSISRITI